MTNRLDHRMYASADLDSAIRQFEILSGIAADRGGSHPGRGTRNALLSLGDSAYLELMAPDPAQRLEGTFGATFVRMKRPQIHAYIVKGRDLEGTQTKLAKLGINTELRAMSRKTPNNELLQWRLLIPLTNPFGEFVPRVIDWMETPHPSETSVSGCTLQAFEIGHPEAEQLGAVMDALDFAADTLSRSDSPYFLARIRTPRGKLTLTS